MKIECGRCGETIQDGTGISYSVCKKCDRIQILKGADHQGFHDGQKNRRNEVVYRGYDGACKTIYDEAFKAGIEDKKKWIQIKETERNNTMIEKITNQQLEDLLITALEGGSNYWYELVKCFRIEKMVKGEVEAKIHDVVDGEFLGVLNRESMLNAFLKMEKSDNERIRVEHLNAILSEDYDAENADIWFQFAVMGEVVYG